MKFRIISSLLVFISSSAISGELSESTGQASLIRNFVVNAFFGPSPYGMLGIELQKQKHSVGFGIPERLFYRYFNKPDSNSMYYGLYAGRYDQVGKRNDEKSFNGLVYTNDENFDAGFGIGHRWKWASGWNVDASLSLHYMHEEYRRAGESIKTEISVILFPGVNAGYTF